MFIKRDCTLLASEEEPNPPEVEASDAELPAVETTQERSRDGAGERRDDEEGEVGEERPG